MIVRTRKLSDKMLHALVKQLLNDISGAEAMGVYAGGINFRVDAASLSEMPRAANERLIETITIKKDGVQSDYVTFARGTMVVEPNAQGQPEQHKFQLRQPNAYFDEIAFFRHYSYQSLSGYVCFSDEERVAAAREIDKLAAPISGVEPEQGAAFGRVLDQNLADLQRLTTDFLERSTLARQNDEEAFRAREAHLQDEFERKFSELEIQRKQLEKRRDELNDREPQHERRRLRELLTDRLQKTIANPTELTVRYERRSNYLYLAAGVFFLLISIFLQAFPPIAVSDGSAAFWALSFKSFIAGVAGAGLIWSGLSGLKAAAVAARRYEQTIQRYAFDMDRASWTVETLLQMNSMETAQVPNLWIEAVCRDLFITDQTKRDEPRSLDALAALLDVTAKAKIGTTGVDFEIDQKGAKRAAAAYNDG